MTAEIIAKKREKPILFNGDMVRAILDDRKTQTRRVVKGMALEWLENEKFTPDFVALPENDMCPFGKVGDQLWVRETFFAYGRWATRFSEKKKRDEWHFIDMTIERDKAYKYDADHPNLIFFLSRIEAIAGWYKRPAIFMSRQASRIQLEITGIRVERLQDISEDDAKSEGLELTLRGWKSTKYQQVFYTPPIMAFQDLWKSTGGDWNANQWVWVIEFKRVAA